MIKFRATAKNGRELFGFGLSVRNLARLLQDKPILIEGQEMGLDHDIMIYAGTTEEAMLAQLQALGVEMPDAS